MKHIIIWYISKIGELPSYFFHYLFSWIYTTSILRTKAAATPYPTVRMLLLRRSGIPIANEVHINYGVLIVGNSRTPPAVTFGDRVAVGPYVTFVTSSYPDKSKLMQHPELKGSMMSLGPISIENDVWIGAGAIILPNVTLGSGSIIGSGAVVTKSIPRYSIAMGSPAKVSRMLSEPQK